MCHLQLELGWFVGRVVPEGVGSTSLEAQRFDDALLADRQDEVLSAVDVEAGVLIDDSFVVDDALSS